MENQQFDENNFSQENDIVNSIINDSIQNENNNSNSILDDNDPIQRQSLFQENLFEPYLNFSNDLEIELFVNPLIFYHNYDNFSYYDMGKKVLAPKFLLHRLSQYNNIEYPIHMKINNTIFTIHDFIEDIDCIYIPTPLFYDIYLTENTIHPITIMKNIPPKASYLKMKPMSDELYSIKDVKKYFEIHLTKLYASVHKFEIIKVPYIKSFIEFKVTDCKPENIVSINEIEELQLEFEPLVEKQMEFTFDSENEENDVGEEKTEEKTEVFVPFSGKGNKLGSK